MSNELNDAIFKVLDDPARSARATDAVNEFTRSRLCLKFTRMPAQGILRRIMPPIPVGDVDFWVARGVPADQLIGEAPFLHPWWESGHPIYELMECRLDREDYARRLDARAVPSYEWRSRARSQRRLGKTPAYAQTALAIERVAYAAVGRIVSQLRVLGQRNL